jgi:hypothetical protein
VLWKIVTIFLLPAVLGIALGMLWSGDRHGLPRSDRPFGLKTAQALGGGTCGCVIVTVGPTHRSRHGNRSPAVSINQALSDLTILTSWWA